MKDCPKKKRHRKIHRNARFTLRKCHILLRKRGKIFLVRRGTFRKRDKMFLRSRDSFLQYGHDTMPQSVACIPFIGIALVLDKCKCIFRDIGVNFGARHFEKGPRNPLSLRKGIQPRKRRSARKPNG